jgi:hypothetical protein
VASVHAPPERAWTAPIQFYEQDLCNLVDAVVVLFRAFRRILSAQVIVHLVSKVQINLFESTEHIVEHGPFFHTGRLASAALLITPTGLIETVE